MSCKPKKLRTAVIFLGIALLLEGCGRSPDSQFYVLSPISYKKRPLAYYSHLRIGIDEIHVPDYLSKPEFIVHTSAHQVKLDEYHRWVEDLDKNTKRVIAANLTMMLPGAALATSPWDIKYKPNYQLQIDMTQFEVDTAGNSILRAEYLIFSNDKLAKQGILYYHQKVPQVNVDALVRSMNQNLNQFTLDLAKIMSQLPPIPFS